MEEDVTCPEPQGAWDGAGYLGRKDPDCFPGWFIMVSARAHLLLSVHRKRAHSPSSKDEHSIGLKDSLLAHSSDPVEMRRLNYQTPGKEQLKPLCPTSSDSSSSGPHAREGVAVLPTSSSVPSLSQWHKAGLNQGYPGVHSLVCKSFSLALSLPAHQAGELGQGQNLVCGVRQTLYEAHCSCPEPGGASTQSWEVLTSACTCIAPSCCAGLVQTEISAEHH